MITLVAVGNVDSPVLEDLRPRLEHVFEVTVQVNGAIPLPEEALEARRNQYRAPVLLSSLPMPSRPDDKVLGVTEVEIFGR